MSDKSKRRLMAALCLAPLSLVSWPSIGSVAAPPRTVLLKLDDVMELRGKGLSDAWKRVRDFIAREGLSASLGVIGESLENPSPRYVDELRGIASDSKFEIWNHGYSNHFVPNTVLGEITANVGTSVDAQFAAIDRTQQLVFSRLGVKPKIFGPHASGTDDSTYVALGRISAINAVWFYGPRRPDTSSLYVFRRTANLEHPLFVPSLVGLQSDLEKEPIKQSYLALQGHPDMWGEDRFQAFVEVVHWLMNQGCKFMCASDFLSSSR